MSQQLSERRMAENEVVFRSYNEKIQQSMDELKSLAEETGQLSHISKDDRPLHFYCECADEKCIKRIRIQPSTYKDIHTHRNQFVIICSHDVSKVEKVVETTPDYCVVEKHIKPSQTVRKLHRTPVDNT